MARRESKLSVIYPGERQDLELFVSCRELKSNTRFRTPNPSIALYCERNGEYELSDSTEIINNNANPDFKKAFNMEFFFAVKQNLKLVILDNTSDDNNKPISEIYTSVGEIMGSKDQTVSFDIKKTGSKDSGSMGRLLIKAERMNYTSDVAKMTIKARQIKLAKKLFKKPSYVFGLRLYRLLRSDGEYGLVYESENRKSENPRWSEIQIKFQKLANGDYDRKIKAEVVNYNSTNVCSVIGECYFTVSNLLLNEMLDYEIDILDKNQQKCGVLLVDSFDLIERPHFLDYIQAGLQFNVMIGVDYTSSNGDPYTPDSLHTIIDEKNLNEYQKAITGVCEILLDYDHDKKVLMFGFGGIPNFPQFKSELTSHCFPLTGNILNPWAEHLEGIMKVYKASMKNVTLASPTYFEPMLRQAMQIAKRNLETNSSEYTILLMLTDGKCHDMQDTINAIIESGSLPLSVIIVGLGDADWKKMEILDGDDGLINFKGQQAVRDLVQFVPFRRFENNPDLLAKNVLEEVPSQVVGYMLSQGIKPKVMTITHENNFNKPIKSIMTGILDEETSEENKVNAFNSASMEDDKYFTKALEFMKTQNNTSYVNYLRIHSNTHENNFTKVNTGYLNKDSMSFAPKMSYDGVKTADQITDN